MKIILKSLITGGFVFAIFYLAGCFYNTSFNINQWTEISRWAVSTFGLFGFFIGFGVAGKLEAEKNK